MDDGQKTEELKLTADSPGVSEEEIEKKVKGWRARAGQNLTFTLPEKREEPAQKNTLNLTATAASAGHASEEELERKVNSWRKRAGQNLEFNLPEGSASKKQFGI